MTIAAAIIEVVKGIPDGSRIRAGVLCDQVNVVLINNGDKRVSESATKRKLRKLKICICPDNSPHHPSDMRVMDRTGEIRTAYRHGQPKRRTIQ